MKKYLGQKSIITAGILLLLLLAFAGTAAAQEGVTYLSAGTCMGAEVERPNCTANDVQYSAFKVIKVIDGCTSTADTFTAQISAEALATANARYDIGFWVGLTDYAATDPDAAPGDGALYGETCYRQILSPLTTVLTEVNATSGVGPYASLDNTDDFCGDIQQGVATFTNMPFGVTAESTTVLTLPCSDPDGDGVANIDACISWENNPNAECESVADALPSTRSKCNCGTYNLTEVPIRALRNIIVDKVTPQDPNSTQEFSFVLNGESPPVDRAAINMPFTLTNSQEPFDSGDLFAGTFSVAETDLPEGWQQDSVTCVDAAGATYDPAEIDMTGDPKTVTCTFTNTQLGPPIEERQIIVDKVTPQKPGSTEAFAFTLEGAPLTPTESFARVEFTLTDGQEPFNSGQLPQGTYRVTEGEPPDGWSLEKAACVDAAGATYDPAQIDMSGDPKTVTCTFTNTFEPPTSGAPLPFLYVLMAAGLLGAGLVALGVLMQRKARVV